MQTTEPISARERTGLETAPELKLLIAYDDFANGRRALWFLESLLDEFDEVFAFVPRFLKFEDLMRPEAARQVQREAADSDVVVLAGYDDAALPRLVQDWIRKLRARPRSSDSPVVVLLRSSDRGQANDRPVQWHRSERPRRNRRPGATGPGARSAQRIIFPDEITWRLHRRMESETRPATFSL